ncbi:hypothetical protein AV530_013020 [Patagioenas fasciata monilis]|uniref:Uncharacterized protein n=1 Tax=Patagioenas fasciata monilis TaxID=372326 RepID=A0A1V4JA66_PATFA|nr:hypothetical protein AV530_013020 [Patagioenas fasciata monilis]
MSLGGSLYRGLSSGPKCTSAAQVSESTAHGNPTSSSDISSKKGASRMSFTVAFLRGHLPHIPGSRRCC